MTIKEKTIQKEMKTIGGSSDPADFDNNIGIYNGKLPTLWKAMEYVYTDPKNAISVSGSVVTAKIKKPKQGQPIEFWMRREVTTTSTSSTASTTSSTVSTISSTISTTTVSSTISTTTVTAPPFDCDDCPEFYDLTLSLPVGSTCCLFPCANWNTTFRLNKVPDECWWTWNDGFQEITATWDGSLWQLSIGFDECECARFTHVEDGSECLPTGTWTWVSGDCGEGTATIVIATTTTAPGGGGE